MKPHIVKVEMETDAGEKGFYFYWTLDGKKWSKAQKRALRGRNVQRAEKWLQATFPKATWDPIKQADGRLPEKYLAEGGKVVLIHPKYTFGSNTPPRLPSAKHRRAKAPVIVLPEFMQPVKGGFAQAFGKDILASEMESATGERLLEVRVGEGKPITLSTDAWHQIVARYNDIVEVLKAYDEHSNYVQRALADTNVMRVAIQSLAKDHPEELEEAIRKAQSRKMN